MTSPRFPWTPILALTLGTLWTVTAELIPAGLLLDISHDTDVSPSRVGLLVTAWGVAIAALSIPLTRATRRLDRRHLLVGSLAGTGLATVLTSLAPSYEILLAARVAAAAGHGLFWASVVVSAVSLVAEQHSSRAVAIVVAGPTVAAVAAIPAATALGERLGWRPAFALVGMLTLATAALLAATLPRMAAAPEGPPGRRDPSTAAVVRTAVLGALILVAHFLAFTFIAPLLGGHTSLALLVFGAAGVLGLLVAPAASRRYPESGLAITAFALAASLLLFALARHDVATALLAVGLWGGVIGALPVIFQVRLLALASEAYRPTAGAVMVVALNLGVAAGAALGGLVHQQAGAAPLPIIAAGLALAAAVALTRRPTVPSQATRPVASALSHAE